jgi:hypothetical protein
MACATACDTVEGLPEGKLAVVGSTVLGPEDLAGVAAQLGPYAQLRFRGVEGDYALLDALVVTELLAQEAMAHGLGDDPRVRFAVLEEIATATLSAELERRIPYESVAAREQPLRELYDADPGMFTRPERRSAQGVLFSRMAQAQEALERLALGTVELGELGDVVSTPLQERDDAEYPRFHPILFDASLPAGAWLPEPVAIGERLLVGRVHEVQPPRLEPFEDPAVQERLVHAVRAPGVKAAEHAYLQELRERYPQTDL